MSVSKDELEVLEQERHEKMRQQVGISSVNKEKLRRERLEGGTANWGKDQPKRG